MSGVLLVQLSGHPRITMYNSTCMKIIQILFVLSETKSEKYHFAGKRHLEYSEVVEQRIDIMQYNMEVGEVVLLIMMLTIVVSLPDHMKLYGHSVTHKGIS